MDEGGSPGPLHATWYTLTQSHSCSTQPSFPSPLFQATGECAKGTWLGALPAAVGLVLCFPQQHMSPLIPTTPVPSTHTLIHVLRQIPPWALKGDAQDVPLSYSQAISARLQLNLCRKYTARAQPSHVCLPQLSHGASPTISPPARSFPWL